MGQSFRVQLLSLSCFVVFIVYWLIDLVVLIPRQCWNLQDFWFNEEVFVNPFWSFNLLILILLCWGLVESYVLIKSVGKKKFKASVLIMSFVFLFAHFSVQITLWQMLKIDAGELTFEDYWIKAVENPNFDLKLIRRKSTEGIYWPTWQEFLFSERCDNGLSLSNITEEEMKELRNKFEGVMNSAIEEEKKALNKQSQSDH